MCKSANEFWVFSNSSFRFEKLYDGQLWVGHPDPEKKSVGIFEYILASMLKVYLDVFEEG